MSETTGSETEVPNNILTFKEFTVRNPIPRYNNLVLYFITNWSGHLHRRQAHFQRFQKENPELEERLRQGLMSLKYFTGELVEPYDADLYEAYKIMRSYDGVSDRNLFG
ncbi:MAG: hypothetical protein WC897_03695 [Candidatus Gracilibacteria bacterium]